MPLSSTMKKYWDFWSSHFNEGLSQIPGIGNWFRTDWVILIAHRDGHHSVPNLQGGQSILSEEQLRHFPTNKRLCLRLGEGLGQQRDIALPAAARHDPAAMIALSLKQYFPFPEEDTTFAVHGIAPKSAPEKNIFRVSFARRSQMENALREVQNYGINPKAVDALGVDPLEPVSADLASGTKAVNAISASKVLVGALVFLVFIATIINMCSSLYLAPQAAQIEVRTRPEATDQAVQQSQAKATVPSVLDLWKAVTMALPDDAYAQYLLYEKGKLRLAGKATDAAMLVNAIEQQGMFSDTTFAAASVKEDDGKESFDLITNVRKGDHQ